MTRGARLLSALLVAALALGFLFRASAPAAR
ncbi:MAG: hypothetical protein H6Q82_3142, partial [Deltaproteobacteria bacterium]|nr:hypothetical protein [Deltaproteobacteria bacterium]